MFKFNKLVKVLLSFLLVFSIASCTFNNDDLNSIFKDKTSFIQLTNKFDESDNVIEQNIDGIDSIERIMEILTSDEFKGRADDTDGNDKTIEYLNEQFKNIGLEYLFKDTYNHQYNFDYSIFPSFTKPEEIEYNVVGLIKGNNHSERKKAVVISAHFDHMGVVQQEYENSGEIYRGAIDNASGTATLLKIAYELKEMSKEELFDTDIIIAAFNHEELGLIGSRAFVEDIKDRYENIYNINLDCVGVITGKPIVVYSSDKRSPELSNAIFSYFDEKNINITKETKIKYLTSDHLSFEYNGFQTILLSDEVGGMIHKTDDTLDKIDFSKLNDVVNYVCEFIKLNDSNTF